MGKILIVDDERSMREFLGICLKRSGHDVSVSSSAKQAHDILDTIHFDVIVTDLRMPGEMDGLDLLKAVKERQLETEVVVMTAFASADTALSAMKTGAYDYLTKPFKVDLINTVINRALEKRSLVEANLALREQVTKQYRLSSIIGKSIRMQKVFALIEKIHSAKTNVLITGESGTGKELVARALHTEGNRAHGKFVAINCGAIPDNLMESELFGHKKGAFTGASGDKVGLFRQANGGTLFLDEIGELGLPLQVKLLRAIQERKIRPVGDETEIEIDVRVLAATNRDLQAEVARGAFREDLYYRLNVIELRLPPLRQRKTDIPLLADHFLRLHKSDTQVNIAGFTPGARIALENYDYRGNVRELENIIERAVTLTDGPRIDVRDLPNLETAPPIPSLDSIAEIIPEEGIDLDQILSDCERKVIRQALQQSGGVKKKAANLLGISFRSIRYRLEKLGLDTEDSQG